MDSACEGVAVKLFTRSSARLRILLFIHDLLGAFARAAQPHCEQGPGSRNPPGPFWDHFPGERDLISFSLDPWVSRSIEATGMISIDGARAPISSRTQRNASRTRFSMRCRFLAGVVKNNSHGVPVTGVQ